MEKETKHDPQAVTKLGAVGYAVAGLAIVGLLALGFNNMAIHEVEVENGTSTELNESPTEMIKKTISPFTKSLGLSNE